MIFGSTLSGIFSLTHRRPVSEAPRDGTPILAYLHLGDRGFGRWQEIYWDPFDCLWHTHGSSQTFAEDVPKCWLAVPPPPEL